jgi:MFS family permease
MKNFRSFLHLPRNVYVLFLARIINSIGSFVYPLMTILLTQKLGYSADRAGTITTVAIAAGGIGMLIGGKIADHVGRKKLFIITSVLGALTFIACAFLGQSKSIVYLIIAGNFISIAQWPTVDAMVTDSTNKENRQNAFSLLYLGTNIGIAVGPLIAGFLINEHLMWFFLLDGITTLLSLIPVIIFIKDTKPTKEQIDAIPETDNERAEKGSVFRAFLKRPLLIAFTSIIVLFTIVYAQYTFGLPLFANSIYGIDGPKIYGLLMSVNAVMVVVLTIFVISFTKKLPPLVSITIGGFLYACGFGMLYFTGNIYLLIVSTIIWTLGEIINTVNIEVFIANNAPVTHRGRFFALITFVQESGFAMSPMLSGFYIASFGIKNIWPIVALFAFVAAASMFGLFMWQKSLRKI